MRTIFYRCILLFVLLFSVGCQGSPVSLSKPDVPKPAYWPTSEWKTSTPEEQGMDSGKLADLFTTIQYSQIKLHSLLIARNGYLVVDAYYPPYSSEIRHTVESNTKSMIGSLIGIAIAQGKIKSVDQKVVDFFPGRVINNLDEKKKAIRIKDLLSMQPGLDCADMTPAGDGMYQTQGWVQYLLDLPMKAEPGKQWVYCSGAVHLLSAVLEKATGMDARSYANQYLFPEIGIPAVEEADWGGDPQGITNGIAGLYLTPRELAKYGLLYLNQGNWDGKQVVPAQWVKDSTTEQAYIGKDEYAAGLDRRFGYLFSLFPDQKYYGYLGRAGQELYVLPEKNMVIVFTGSMVVGKEGDLLKLINDYILPAAKSDQALPEAKESFTRLQGLLPSAATQKQPVKPLSQIALDISGKTYQLDQNSIGWKTMNFIFQQDSPEAVLKLEGSPDLTIGLDGVYRLTPIPNGRPIGIRASWKSADKLYLEYLTLGDYPESAADIQFQGNEITLSIYNLNFGGEPMILHGAFQP